LFVIVTFVTASRRGVGTLTKTKTKTKTNKNLITCPLLTASHCACCTALRMLYSTAHVCIRAYATHSERRYCCPCYCYCHCYSLIASRSLSVLNTYSTHKNTYMLANAHVVHVYVCMCMYVLCTYVYGYTTGAVAGRY